MFNISYEGKEYEVRFRYDQVRFNRSGEMVYYAEAYKPDGIILERPRVACSIAVRIHVRRIERTFTQVAERKNDVPLQEIKTVPVHNGYVTAWLSSGMAYLHPGENGSKFIGRAIAFERAIGWMDEPMKAAFRKAYKEMGVRSMPEMVDPNPVTGTPIKTR